VDRIKIIAFTHKTLDSREVGKLHIGESELRETLLQLKHYSAIDELMYLSTCNRVEFLLTTSAPVNNQFLLGFFRKFNPGWSEKEINWAAEKATVYEGNEALVHIFNVASSLDSMIVGEREIITQVRNAYDLCKSYGITGDVLRMLIKKTIETAKQVYTETNIAAKSVSVVSLAYRKLKELNVKLNARFLFIGAGVTNSTMAKYLKKHGFKNFVVFNRTVDNARKLASELKGKAFPLNELSKYDEGFDVMVTCTGSSNPIVNREIYNTLIKGDRSKKIVIDLAVPGDLDPVVLKNHDIHLIAINTLEAVAKENLKQREKELVTCRLIIEQNSDDFGKLFKVRKVELAMSEVPKKIKEIRETVLNELFAKDIENLDNRSKEVIEKILSYVEKKYISLPMKMAKEILVEKVNQNNSIH